MIGNKMNYKMILLHSPAYFLAVVTVMLLLVVSFDEGVMAFQWFNAKRPHYTQSELYKLTPSLNLTDDAYVAAYADMNGDAYMDIVTFSPAGKKLQILLWSHQDFNFASVAAIQLPLDSADPVNIAIADFNYDGQPDLYIQWPDRLSVYFGPEFSITGTSVVTIGNTKITGQPAIVDMNGDLRAELFGIFNDTLGTLIPTSSQATVQKSHEQFCTPHDQLPVAFVDLDGDCAADLFIPCKGGDKYEIWLNNFAGSFTKHSSGSLPADLRSLTFSDFNADGTIDLLMVTCPQKSFLSSLSSGAASNCQLHLVLNRQIPTCSAHSSSISAMTSSDTDSSTRCRKFSDLCLPDYKFTLDFNGRTIQNLAETIGQDGRSDFPLKSGYQFNSIKVGDMDMDAYSDLVFVISNNDQSSSFVAMLRNVHCGSVPRSLSQGEKCGDRFFANWPASATSALSEFKAVEQVALFDLDERGSFDMFIVSKVADGRFQMASIFNNFFNDAYYLKIFTTHGVCFKNCPSSHPAAPVKPLGTNYPGATFKFSVLDPNGGKRFSVGSQLSIQTHGALQMPFNLYGLGRTNNYIEEFYVGVPTAGNEYSRFIRRNGLIPNSQILVHPPSRTAAIDWIFELFISPGDYVIFVLLTLLISMVLLAALVAFLQFKEKREDEEERRRALHIINFDAL